MDVFNRANLSPMQSARLDACLAKRFRFSDGIRTLGEDIEARHARGEIVGKKTGDGMADYSRTKFNRMDGREQAAYTARLAARRYYYLQCTDGFGRAVPKMVYDAVNVPEVRP